MRFRDNLEDNLIVIQDHLVSKEYQPGNYWKFTLYEPKMRLIYVSPFRDRIIHHAIMNIIEPIWNGLFLDDSYACRRMKGTHMAMYRVVDFFRRAKQQYGKVYCLKADISKFFPSINHHVLMRIIERKIKCRDTLNLIRKIVFNNGDESDPGSKDMPIGSLLSQWAANLYLNELDYHIKHVMRVKFYVRYMDDFVLLDADKARLHGYKAEISAYLNEHLQLQLNPKSDIYPADRGIDFVGYRIWPSYRLIRKTALVRATKRFKRLSNEYEQGLVDLAHVNSSVMSWLGHCGHAHVLNGKIKCLESLVLKRPQRESKPLQPAAQS
ncbi:MAG: reverse transcriptase/maturase family protein, partial [Syntrophales bacterium LBB04]|nr:reverse transcriptase/maturase family protein [Syntrophales bacterium LBB04]